MFFRWCKDGSGDGPSSGAPEFGGTRHPAQQAASKQQARKREKSDKEEEN